MGGWLLAVAAAGAWVGIMASGAGVTGPGSGFGVAAVGMGLCALAALAGWARLRGGVAAAPAIALIALGFAALGAGWSSIRIARVASSPVATLARAHAAVEIDGSLGSDPEQHPSGWTAILRVDAVRFPGLPNGGADVREDVWMQGRGRAPRLQAGDRVGVRGVLQVAEGDFGRYLERRGFAGSLRVEELDIRGPPSNPVLRGADSLRAGLAGSLGRMLPPRDAGLVMGLVLGDTSRLDPAVEEDFRATGLSHLTAVSGENVAMFLAPVLGLVTFFGVGRAARLGIGLGIIPLTHVPICANLSA